MADPVPYEPYGGGLPEEQRDNIVDLLALHRVSIWSDESELDEGHFRDWTLAKWLDVIGHPSAHPGCCRTCGCATTCMGGAFEQSLTDTILRELNRHGLLRRPSVPDRAAALRDVETFMASVTNVDDRGMFFLADDERREFLTAPEFAALIVDRALGAEQDGEMP